jgi:hypothetical protein
MVFYGGFLCPSPGSNGTDLQTRRDIYEAPLSMRKQLRRKAVLMLGDCYLLHSSSIFADFGEPLNVIHNVNRVKIPHNAFCLTKGKQIRNS